MLDIDEVDRIFASELVILPVQVGNVARTLITHADLPLRFVESKIAHELNYEFSMITVGPCIASDELVVADCLSAGPVEVHALSEERYDELFAPQSYLSESDSTDST